ncbi:MAG: hypothetical protein ACFB0B_02175 [Thermonemataceae bacterium]
MNLRYLVVPFLLVVFLLTSCDQSSTESDESTDTSSTDKVEKATVSSIKIDQKANSRAEIFAAMPLEDTTHFGRILAMPAVKKHYTDSDTGWRYLDRTYLTPLRKWRDEEIKDMNKKGNTLFYPFSGPDFLNAYTLFPDCDNYIMLGLEKVGELPDGFAEKDEPYVNNYLSNIRNALEDIFKRNYFITSYMGSDLYRVSKGVLPIINVFLARTNNEIVGIHRLVLDEAGKPSLQALDKPVNDKDSTVTGLAIEFKNEKKDYTQWIYYFGMDASDEGLANKQEIDVFFRSFPSKVAYLKSASYILFNPNFMLIKNVIMEDVEAVLQDDTGVRYRDYVEAGNWNIQLYGNYATPIRDFGSYTHQPTLRRAYQENKQDVKRLGFPYGYQWRDTEKVSLLVCRKK